MRLNEGFIGVCGWLCAGIGVAGLFPFSLCMWGIGWGGEGGWLVGPFQAGGGLVGCVQSQELCACAPRLLRFILLVSFNETLLVVLILDMVYNCHLRRRLQP